MCDVSLSGVCLSLVWGAVIDTREAEDFINVDLALTLGGYTFPKNTTSSRILCYLSLPNPFSSLDPKLRLTSGIASVGGESQGTRTRSHDVRHRLVVSGPPLCLHYGPPWLFNNILFIIPKTESQSVIIL